MKCMDHPEVEAEALCALCQAPICGGCAVELNGKYYCRRCLAARVTADGRGINTKHSAFTVLVLSLLPGAGYMYLGLMNRGLQAMIIFFGSVFLPSIVGVNALVGMVVPVLIFYSIFDSLQLAAKMRDGLFIDDKPYIDLGNPNWQNILGYVLVGVGFLGLLNNAVNFLGQFSDIIPFRYVSHVVYRLMPPLLIITIGAYILYRNIKGSVGGGKNDDGTEQG